LIDMVWPLDFWSAGQGRPHLLLFVSQYQWPYAAMTIGPARISPSLVTGTVETDAEGRSARPSAV
jgi:hypothetical protein